MAINTYDNLVTAIGNWLHKSNLSSNIPEFIELAERRLSRDLTIDPLCTSTAVVVASITASSALPSDYTLVTNAKLQDSGEELYFVRYEDISREQGRAAAEPWLYTVKGDRIQVAPAATSTATIIVSYLRKPPPLSAGNQTNYYMDTVPDLLLYASLMEAEPFLINDARVPLWKSKYDEILATVNARYGSGEEK